MTAEAKPLSVAVGERVVLTIKLTGSGSVDAVKAPTHPALEGAEVETLPSQDADQVTRTAAGIQGSRLFQYVITPKRVGRLRIPAIPFVFFDPEEERFQTIRTSPFDIDVAEATRTQVYVGPTQTDDGEIRDIRGESDLKSRRSVPLHRTTAF